MYDLPVFETIGATWRFIAANAWAWLKYSLGTIVLVVAVLAAVVGVVWMATATEDDVPFGGMNLQISGTQGAIGGLLALGLILFLLASYCVNWHRHYLVGPEATRLLDLVAWKRRHLVFFGRAVVIAIMSILVFIAAGLLAQPLLQTLLRAFAGSDMSGMVALMMSPWMVVVSTVISLLIYSFVLAVVAGFLPSLPAAAVEDGVLGLGQSWRLTRGNRRSIMWIVMIGSVIPFTLIQSAIQGAVLAYFMSGAEDPFAGMSTMQASGAEFFLPLLDYLLFFLALASSVSLMSVAYRRLRENVPLTAVAPPPPPPAGDREQPS